MAWRPRRPRHRHFQFPGLLGGVAAHADPHRAKHSGGVDRFGASNTAATYVVIAVFENSPDRPAQAGDLHIYVPVAEPVPGATLLRDNGVPLPDDPRHADFTREVKLEPFRRAHWARAGARHLWFTAIRSEQTEHRAGLQPVTVAPGEVLKVAPVFHWSTKQMHEYLKRHRLPNNFDYYDPTKVEEKRECGLHLAR